MKKLLCMLLAAVLAFAAFPALAGCAFYDQNGYHNYAQVDFAYGTCTTDGYYVIECQNCGITQKEITEKAFGHDWVKQSGKAASCEEKGYANYECSNCGETKKESLKALGHNWEDLYTIKEASCQSKGEVASRCTRCGIESVLMTKKSDHSYSAWTEQEPAHGIGMGVRSRSCKNCGHTQSEEYYPEGTLYRGGKDDKEAVKELQSMLKDLGFLKDKVDGAFGKNTEKAVKDYQQHALFEPDGIAWPGIISALSIEWEIETYGAEPEPTAEPAPTMVFVPSEDGNEAGPCCSRVENADGSVMIVHCQAHQLLADTINTLLASAQTQAAREKAFVQGRALWQTELNMLYLSWLDLANEEEKGMVAANQAMFAAYLDAQEKMWNMQYGENSAEAAQKASEMLIGQCADICALVYSLLPAAE